MAKKAALYDEARRRYVEDGQTLAAIGKALQVSPTTLVGWKKAGDWERDRARHRQQVDSIWDMIPTIVRRTCERVQQDLDRGEVDPQKLHAVRALLGLVIKPRKVEVAVATPPADGEARTPSPHELRRLIEQILQTEYGVRG